MEISKGIEIIDLGLFFREGKILVITDFQLGYEEYMNDQGVMVPRVNFDEIKKHLEKIFGKLKGIEKVIINGDLKHEFGKISEQEWREILQLLEFIGKNCKEIVIVKGNHDAIIKPIAEMKKIKVADSFVLEKEKTLFVHGHKEPAEELLKGIERIVIGHEHPAITISDGVKQEKYKCFLKGKYEGKELIVLPSFNFVAMGTDVSKEKFLSPIVKNASEFEVFVTEDKVYAMGKLEELI